MAGEYNQTQLHRPRQTEEEQAKRECSGENKSATPFATADADVAKPERKNELVKETAGYDGTDNIVGVASGIEVKDRGLFGNLTGKKAEEEEVNGVATGIEKVPEEKKEEMKVQSSNSGPLSYSGDEEEGEEGEMKKKRDLTEKIKARVSGDNQKDDEKPKIKALDKEAEAANAEPTEAAYKDAEEKLPVSGQTSDNTENAPATSPPMAEGTYTHEQDPKEKKGIFKKIKEKIQIKPADN